MKEIRLHGRGGQGVVKSSHIVVSVAVEGGAFGQFIPFFGVERKGSPVYGFLRIDNKPIRLNTQVYEPETLMIYDDSLITMPETYAGLREGGLVIINTTQPVDKLRLPKQAAQAAIVDATGIAYTILGRNIPNTAMLGALAKVTGLVEWELLQKSIADTFGGKNVEAAKSAYDSVSVTNL